jgi:lysozyme
MPQSPISPTQRAWLDTVAHAEGTYGDGGLKGYRTMFGYQGELDTSKGHPNQVIHSGGYSSAAAGRYQFMPDTWAAANKALGLDGRMTPENQDRAALYLMQQRGVDTTKPMTTEGLARLAPEWASLPTAAGKSYYGQPVKSQKDLLGFFSGRVGAAGQAPNPGNTAAPTTKPPTGGGGATGGGGLIGSLGNLFVPPAYGGGMPSINAGGAIGAAGSNPVMGALQRGLDMLSTPDPFIRRPGTKPAGSTGQRMAGSPPRSYLERLQSLIQLPSF